MSLVFYHSTDRLCRSLQYSPRGSDHLVNINTPSGGHFFSRQGPGNVLLLLFFFFFSILIEPGCPDTQRHTRTDVRKAGQLISFSGKELNSSCNFSPRTLSRCSAQKLVPSGERKFLSLRETREQLWAALLIQTSFVRKNACMQYIISTWRFMVASSLCVRPVYSSTRLSDGYSFNSRLLLARLWLCVSVCVCFLHAGVWECTAPKSALSPWTPGNLSYSRCCCCSVFFSFL